MTDKNVDISINDIIDAVKSYNSNANFDLIFKSLQSSK